MYDSTLLYDLLLEFATLGTDHDHDIDHGL
jgi:hypothetical protein